MNTIYIHKDYNRLRRFLPIMSSLVGVKTVDLFCNKDTSEKIYTIWCVRQCFDFNDKQLAQFFNINVGFMISKLQDFEVELLMSPQFKEEICMIVEMHKRLEEVYNEFQD